ncbi:cadmium resistance transporter [Synechocystis sp. PCC 6714]|uniref:cadmium resistance transporter n=1 Tax=Synechocystis sp. (strain PCC 6714) TaxID=1147 RepID=UPI001EE65E59|nr:cadmium resistance transporter [Synechocystis sp. PCC 6714]
MSAFVATNLDDVLILMFFFSQAKSPQSNLRIRHIVFSQYIGFIVIILLSLPGFFGGLIVSKEWTGLLGLVPIFIGIKHLHDLSSEDEAFQSLQNTIQSPQSPPTAVVNPISAFLSPQVYGIAAISIANGGDNIGIYVPFFASLSWLGLWVVISIFLVLVAARCATAYYLTGHPLIRKIVTRYGQRIMPFVLIGLGVWIFGDSGSYKLLRLLLK